jgi:hypothetical protein
MTPVQFCSVHGTPLVDMRCEACNRTSSNYLPEEIARRNRGNKSWADKDYVKREVERAGPPVQRYYCDTCEYFMYHRITWCPMCGQKMADRKLTYAQMVEQFGHYKEGC